MQQSLPKSVIKHSIKIQVEKGKIYYWCSCGLSSNQPFCNGSHCGTGFTPIAYTASEDKIVSFCGCKHSKKGPICDGTHRKLEDTQ